MIREVMAFVPLFVMLGWAAVVDVRARRIPNWLTGTLVLAGLIQSGLGVGVIGLGQAGTGVLVGLAVTFVFFALGGMGAGDVKLFAGIGAWVGPLGAIQIFVVERVVGIVVVVVQALRERRLGVVLRGSVVLGASAAITGNLTGHAIAEDAVGEKQTRLPYAVPTLIAAALVMALRWGWL